MAVSGDRFTDQQRRAITERGRDLLVAAAAGSGKTAVLSERIVRLVTEEGADVDRLLVVTFTEAAAAEMRERISKKLFAKLEEDPDNEHLRRQTTLLGKAAISTIHAFCLDVARKFFYMTDVDPGFKVGDQIETELLKAEVIAALFEEEYDREGNRAFLDLVDAYGGPKTSDDGLVSLVLQLHAFLRNLPWSKRWLEDKLRMFAGAEDAEAEQGGFAPWLPVIMEHARAALEGALENLEGAAHTAAMPDGPGHYLATLENEAREIRALLEACGAPVSAGAPANLYESFQALYGGLEALSFARLPSKKNAGDEALKEKAKRLRDAAKEALAKLRAEVFFKPPGLLREDMRAALPALETLCALTTRFEEAYQAAKKERNIVDFNDLERICLDILLAPEATPDNPAPSEAAVLLSEKFHEIMVDEYQDSNAVQELILSLISGGGPPNRFMVGDIKQSIYKFRRAEPAIFLRKYNEFAADGEAGGGLRVDLSQNFRSRAIVLDAVNFLFEQLMTPNVGDIAYDERAALRPGAVFPDDAGVNVTRFAELHVVEARAGFGGGGEGGNGEFGNEGEAEDGGGEDAERTLEERLEREARIVAGRIVEMTEGPEPLFVYDGDTKNYRPACYGDIVILTRSVKSVAAAFTAALTARGVPVLAETGQGYFGALEVSTVLALLQVIDNPKQDIPLLAALRSPIYGFTPEELLNIRRAKDGCVFYDALSAYFENESGGGDPDTLRRAQGFLADLSGWRSMAAYTPISALISALYADTGYVSLAGAMPGGDARQANLTALLDVAAGFEKTSYKGLFHFNKYMEKLWKHAQDAEGSKVFSENENVVRVMTIHKSKGLEFPIVFVSALGKGFSPADERADILLHQDMGFGPRYVDTARRLKTKTLAGAALSIQTRRENLGEELRVLYVALTRAKEKLVLTGTVADIGRKREVWGRYAGRAETALPWRSVLAGGSFLDWVAAAVARHRDGAALRGEDGEDSALGNEALFNHAARFQVFVHGKNEDAVEDSRGQAAHGEAGQTEPLAPPPEAHALAVSEEVAAKLSWEYPYLAESRLPTKLSISEIKRIHQEEMEDKFAALVQFDKPIYRKPDFLKSERGFSAAETGTFLHTVMEHMDLRARPSRADMEALLALLIRKNILTEEEAAAVPLNQIEEFTRSGLAERMRRARLIKKETPFVLALRPGDVYPGGRFDDVNARVLAHGIIDCYFVEESGDTVLVDYKSDSINDTGADIEAVKLKYATQLALYKRALEMSAGLRVRECLLYLFALGRDVPLNV